MASYIVLERIIRYYVAKIIELHGQEYSVKHANRPTIVAVG